MDINDWRGVATVLALIAFIGVTLWTYSAGNKKSFDDAAQSPFADEPKDQ